jgi:hypothetical protein
MGEASKFVALGELLDKKAHAVAEKGEFRVRCGAHTTLKRTQFPQAGCPGSGRQKRWEGEESVTDKGKRGVAFGLKEKEGRQKKKRNISPSI